MTNEAYNVYFRAKKRKIFNAAKINSCYQPHSKIVLEFQSSKLRFSPAAAVVQLKGSSIAKLETSYKIQWMASGTSISILYLAAKEIRKKKEMHTCSTHSSTFLQDQLSFDGQELWHFFEESCSSSTVAKNQEEPPWVNVWLSFGLGKQIILVFFAQSFVLVLKHLVKRILKRYRYYSTNQAFLLKPKNGENRILSRQ